MTWVVHFLQKMGWSIIKGISSTEDGTGLTQYCIGQILLETGRAREAEEKFQKILSGCRS